VTRIRIALIVVAAGLAVSGLTAFPLEAEVAWLHAWLTGGDAGMLADPSLVRWVARVHHGLAETNVRHRHACPPLDPRPGTREPCLSGSYRIG
jgi:hypothetical protein